MIEKSITLVVVVVPILACIASAHPQIVNFKIGFNITDARGRPFIGLDNQQPEVTLTFMNKTIQKKCISCVFDIKNLELANGTIEFVFNITVKWLSKLVYSGSEVILIDPSLNNSMIKVLNGSIRVQALNLEVYGTNDEGGRLSACTLVERELGVQLRCGRSVSLPFGAYSVTDARYEVTPNVWVRVSPLTASFQVSNTTASVNVALSVAGSYFIDVRRADGSPLNGAGVELVYIDAGNITLFKGVTQGMPLRLSNVPYGRYMAIVTWKGEQLLRTLIQVDRTTRNVTLTTKLLPIVALNVLDADHQPIANLTLRLVGPACDTLMSTDTLGRVFIRDAVEGLYTIQFSWMNQTITRHAYVKDSETTVELPLRRIVLKLTPSTRCTDRCTLPPGLSVRVLYGGVVLMEGSVEHPTSAAEFELPRYVLTSALLKLEVSWNATLLLSDSFAPEEKVVSFGLPFFGLSVRINDARGNPLPRALVIVTDLLGKRVFTSDAYGMVDAKYLYGTSAALEVVWGGVKVAKRLIDASSEQVAVDTSVYPVTVEVGGVLGPIAKARVTVLVTGFDYSFNSSALTGDDGRAELVVPYPPGSNSTLLVTKGRITFQTSLSTRELLSEEPVRVKLDLLLDYEWMQLRTWEFIAIAATVAILLVSALLVLRYISTRRALEGVFATYGGELEEEEEEEEEGLLDRLRSIFQAERESEEEEESGLFYEEEL